ncbi:hypothetical protein [Candidatus Alkanophaga liquidiphilum]
MMVRIIDEPRRGRWEKPSTTYLESGVLLHISKYALREARVGDRKTLKVIYDVPTESDPRGMYEFRFTNNGSHGKQVPSPLSS